MKCFFRLAIRLPGGGAVCECSASEHVVFPSGFDPEGRFEWPLLVGGFGSGCTDGTGKNKGDEYDSTVGRHCDHLLHNLTPLSLEAVEEVEEDGPQCRLSFVLLSRLLRKE